MSKPQSPLAFRDYRLFWISRFCAVLAQVGMVVVIGWQVYDIARTDYGMGPKAAAFQLGLIGIAQFLPLLVLMPVAGWMADRFDRRFVASAAISIDLLNALALGWMTAHDSLTLPALFIVAGLHGVVRAFNGPSLSSIAPNLVPPESLPRAIAMSSIAWQTGGILGPALGGLAYAAHPASSYWIAAALLAITTASILSIRPYARTSIKDGSHPLRQMIDGLSYVRGHRFLLGAITLDLFAVLLAGATALLPVYARDILKIGPEGLGWLRGAPALGATVMALWFSVRPLANNVGIKMLAAVIAFGVATIVFGISTNLWLSLSMLTILGAADMLSVYVRSSLVQLYTPDEMRGRVNAVSQLAISGSNELGEAQSGLAAALVGPIGAVVVGGAGAIAVTLIWAYIFPELRRAKTFDLPKELTT
ncbi:MAG: MFS transporter [Sphingomonadales bacterium]|nr:MFS transporter [Sphingomonadales bacterium]